MTKCEKNLIRLKLSQISNGYTYNPAIYIYIYIYILIMYPKIIKVE